LHHESFDDAALRSGGGDIYSRTNRRKMPRTSYPHPERSRKARGARATIHMILFTVMPGLAPRLSG